MENKIVTLQRIIADAQTTTGETFEVKNYFTLIFHAVF
jgi:hypothetical protein